MAGKGIALVSGGAGFIGSHLVEHLLAAGERVRVLDSFVNGKEENLAALPHQDRIEVRRGDVTSLVDVTSAMRNVSKVFHLAALGVRHSLHNPEENERANAYGAFLMLKCAYEAGVERYVHCSTSEIYGTARTAPMTEDHPALPHTIYGASKLAGEAYARAYHDSFGMPTVIVRPFNAYGPRCHHEGDSGEVIPIFVLRALARQPLVIYGDGTQTRDFTYVADTARALALAGCCEAAVGETLNAGSNREITMNELARVVAEVVGWDDVEVVHVVPRPGDTLRLCADTTKAERVLGFRAEVPLREGIARLVAWYRQQPASLERLLGQARLRNWENRPEHQ